MSDIKNWNLGGFEISNVIDPETPLRQATVKRTGTNNYEVTTRAFASRASLIMTVQEFIRREKAKA